MARYRHAGVVLAALAAAVVLLAVASVARGQSEGEGSTGFSQPSDFERGEASGFDATSVEPTPPNVRIDEDPDGNPYIAGELNVVYEARATTQAAGEIRRESGAEVEANLPEIDSQTLAFPGIKDEDDGSVREDRLEEIRRNLEDDPAVEAVSYNYVSEVQATPNDTHFGLQWGLPRIKAPQAWDTAVGNKAMIAVIDSGVATHPDVSNKVVAEFDYLNNDDFADDGTGHGTHVAGIAAAFTNNGAGVAGSSPNSPVLALKVCGAGATGCPNAATNAAIVDAANFVHSTHGRTKVMNLSLRGFANDPQQQAAVNYAWSKGVVVVAAAGNDATSTPVYPASYTNAIAVSSTNINNGDSDFSNFGSWVDIAAPGGQGNSAATCTDNNDILSTYLNGSYQYLCGTSMASPFVAGVAGLLASQGRTAPAIRSRIESTATDLGASGKDAFFGHGLVNAQAAVTNTVNICATNTPPAIIHPLPKPNSRIVRRGVQRIQATVTDKEFILSKSNIVVSVDGRSTRRFSHSPRTGVVSLAVRGLKSGRHIVRVGVKDPCGKQKVRAWRFRVR